jgi:riboflavin synthase alpha subunit
MASAVESGMTVTEALRLMSAALAGKVTVDGTSVTFRDVNDTTDRITATVTSEGDRTAVILDAS